MAMCAKDITGKLLAVFFTIMLFVTAGFEHCVANMYYITAGILAKNISEYTSLAIQEYGCTLEQLDNLNLVSYTLFNLVPVTIGNILGGIVFVGVPMICLNTNRTISFKNLWKKEEKINVITYSRMHADTTH